MLTLKPGVIINPGPLDPLMKLLEDVSAVHGEIVITSGNDGKHAENSYHYHDRAVDIRSRGRSFEALFMMLKHIDDLATERGIDLHIRVELHKDKARHYWWKAGDIFRAPGDKDDLWDSRHIHLQIGR